MTGTFSVSATAPEAPDPTFASDTENFSVPGANAINKGFFCLIQTAAASNQQSNAAQSVEINFTSLPVEGIKYRVLKTTASGQWYTGPVVTIDASAVGQTTNIDVSGVNFSRTVKIQCGTGVEGSSSNLNDISFDYLKVNNAVLYDGNSTATPISTVFNANPDSNSSWPYNYQSVQYSDGDASLDQQVFILNIPALPAGGANYQIYKTLAENSDDTDLSASIALQEGINIITVGQAGWDPTISGNTTGRIVKIRLSTDVEVNEFAANGTYIIGNDPDPLSVPEGSVQASSEFTATSDADWQQFYTLTTAQIGGVDNPSSKQEQTISFNVTAMSANGAEMRTYRTLKSNNAEGNPSSNTTDAQTVKIGANTVTVDAVDWNEAGDNPSRTVKFQLSKDVAIDKLIVNGTYIVGTDSNNLVASAGSVLASDSFDTPENASWPYWHTLTTTTTDDGAASKAEQVVTFYVTEMAAGGSTARVQKTLRANNASTGEANTNKDQTHNLILESNTK
jgi:hypothetical protein